MLHLHSNSIHNQIVLNQINHLNTSICSQHDEIHIKVYYAGSTHDHWCSGEGGKRKLIEALQHTYTKEGVLVLDDHTGKCGLRVVKKSFILNLFA